MWKNNSLIILDQSRLPGEESYLDINELEELLVAIKHLKIRGAPLLGIAAAFGLYLGVRNLNTENYDLLFTKCQEVYRTLKNSRPTAVNLFRMLDRQLNLIVQNSRQPVPRIKEALLNEALLILEEDRKLCDQIGHWGNSIIPEKANIITHCNAGALATGGIGTALGVIFKAHQTGKELHIYVDETRPLLQGARLTTWELQKRGIPFTLICDNMAAYLMQLGMIQLCITGADRIAANGDTANKIGTYSLAVLSDYHHIPFYVAAPSTTIDTSIQSGADIPIEQRPGSEITRVMNQVEIAPPDTPTYSPAFDITPYDLITAIITENAVFHKPYSFS